MHTCYFCGKDIEDYDMITAIHFKNKYGSISYAHSDCQKLFDYAGKCIRNLNKVKFRQQYKKFLNEGMTTIGIANALRYWYKIKKNSDEKANGSIGIVPYIYEEAQEYFKKKQEAKQKANKMSANEYLAYSDVINKPLPKIQKRIPPKKPYGVKYIDLK